MRSTGSWTCLGLGLALVVGALLPDGQARAGQGDAPRAEPLAPVAEKPQKAEADQVGLGQMRRWLEVARRDLANQQYVRAVAELQKVLDTPEDRTVKPDDAGPDTPQESLKFTALTLLGELVKSGRRDYESQFGELARELLEEAKENGSAATLEVIVRRYFHTKAGYEATYRLASLRLDRGAWLDAALDFDRIRNCPWASRDFEPDLSLKTGFAWHRAGYNDLAVKCLMQLKASGVESIRLAGKTVPLFDREEQVVPWLVSVFGPGRESRGPSDWRVTGGGPRRTGVSQGGTPYLNQGWHRDSILGSCDELSQDEQLQRILKTTMGSVEGARPPMIPAVQPLLVGDLMIYRSLGGLRAVNAITGEKVWQPVDQDFLLDKLIQTSGSNTRSPWPMLPMFVTDRAWRDQTYGTLSSNGSAVFAVEPSITPMSDNNRIRVIGTFYSTDNRLVAYDAKGGSSLWEIGSPPNDPKDPFSGAYFLGPPLPVGDWLYVLVDYSGDIRLVCISPQTGAMEWSQSLGMPLQQAYQPLEPSRRLCGLSPSFSGGIFICPTEEGKIVAFDRTTRTLLWQFDYEPEIDNNVANLNALRFQRLRMQAQAQGGMGGIAGNEADRWVDALVTVADDRVIVTPRTLGEVLCLDLRKGTVLWRAARDDGLFVAGLWQDKVIIVGQQSVTARRLSDGQPAWSNGPVPIPAPSGRGFISGGQLFLPLSTGSVVPIALDKGQKGPESMGKEGRVPGNLVATPDAIISQGVDFIDGYQHFGAMQAEVTAALLKNPDDPDALRLRGEMRLQQGQAAEAYADFQRALQLKPDNERVRRILVDSLLEGLRTDFKSYRSRADELDSLITDVRQRSTFLQLLGQGLEQAGDKPAAFKTYLRLMDPKFESIPPLERNGTTLSNSRLVLSRLTALAKGSSEAELTALVPEVRQRWEAVLAEVSRSDANADVSVAALRQYLSYFKFPETLHPELTRIADEAEQRLLQALEADGRWLEVELQLRSKSDATPEAAAARLARWGTLLARTSRPREAAPVLQQLQSEFKDTIVGPNQTGGQVAAEWLARPELQVAAEVEWPVAKPRVDRQPQSTLGRTNKANTVPVERGRGLFFSETTFEIDGSFRELTARDRLLQPLWKQSLSTVSTNVSPLALRSQILDHLVILSLGTQLVAIDTLGTAKSPGPRILWRHVLSDGLRLAGGIQPRAPFGLRRMFPQDPLGNPILGLVGMTRDLIYVIKPSAASKPTLTALNTVTGETEWTREVAPGPVEVLTDGERVFVLPYEATTATVYSALDGSPLGTRTVPEHRLTSLGRDVVTWDHGTLTRFDLWTEKEVWRQQFLGLAIATVCEDDEVVIAEPDRFAVVDLTTGRRRIDNPQGFVAGSVSGDWTVHRTRDRYVLFPTVGMNMNFPDRQLSAKGWSGTIVVGNVHGFARDDGRRLWWTTIDGQGLETLQSPHLPVTFFLTTVRMNGLGGNPNSTHTLAGCLDNRTGEMLYDDVVRDPIAMLTETLIDPQKLQIVYRFYQNELTLDFTRPPDEKSKEPEPAKP